MSLSVIATLPFCLAGDISRRLTGSHDAKPSM
jgi:hypothetical protein